MQRTIEPCTSALQAIVRVPGSKSITNRALICAALARGESVLRHASDSEDTALMCNGLNQLGVLVRRVDDSLIVSGTGGNLYAPKFPIPVGNAGTTLRFLVSLAALARGTTVFEGDARMAERPMEDLLESLRRLGVGAEVSLHGRYAVHGGTFHGGSTRLNASKSSQFLSSLLLAAPYAQKDVLIELDSIPVSEPYVDMTTEVMRRFGVNVERTGTGFHVQAGRLYGATVFDIEPDASGATYFFAAAALCGGSVQVDGLHSASTQPDIRFLDLLRRMGCIVEDEEAGIRVTGTGTLHGIEADMNAMPDAVPTLAVLAPFASTPTRIVNVAHLRYKESDRLAAVEAELRKLGANAVALDDGLEIHPSHLHGGVVDTYSDHRLAMSFALIGLKVRGIEIENPSCVKKSFPGFWDEFDKLTSQKEKSLM